MLDSFQEITAKLTALKFDSADYVCLKFILLLNPGERLRPPFPAPLSGRSPSAQSLTLTLFADVRSLSNRSHVHECHEQVHLIINDYCVNCYPNVPVSIATTTISVVEFVIERRHFLSSTWFPLPLDIEPATYVVLFSLPVDLGAILFSRQRRAGRAVLVDTVLLF